MKNKRYKQTFIPKADLPEEWKGIRLHELKNHCIQPYTW